MRLAREIVADRSSVLQYAIAPRCFSSRRPPSTARDGEEKMSGEVAHAAAVVLGSAGERARGRSKYFLAAALVLLALVFTGFARTFFGRAFFDVPPIPWYLFAHGIVLASWFLLLVTQTVLVAAHRTDLHRRLGILGGFVAVALLGLSLVVVLGFPAHFRANLLSIDETFPVDVVRAIVWTDLGSLVIFTTFVGAALYWRRRSDVHRRLMLLASMAILGPAVARIVSLLAPPLALGAAIQTLLLVGLPLTIVLHDLLTTRRVHWVSIAGLTSLFAVIFGAFAIANSGMGAAFVAALE
jgi:hypothetical protein